jgi:hypothetical protein
MVDQIFTSWNPLTSWMRQIEDFQRAKEGGLPNGNPHLGLDGRCEVGVQDYIRIY